MAAGSVIPEERSENTPEADDKLEVAASLVS